MAIRIIFCLFFVSFLGANPQKVTIKAGKASILKNGASLDIQVPDRAVLHWDSFSIQPHETTRFKLPSSDAAVLNRVTGLEASQIMGKLEANGKVYLINPNGILIGKDAVIHTSSFVASTLSIEMREFQGKGDLHFFGDSLGKIENLGTILTASGPVVLLARQVSNQGTIDAPHVSIGAGSEFLVKPAGDTELFIRPDSDSSIDNEGTIKGLVIHLQTDGAGALAINHDGMIQATEMVHEGGRVFLRAEAGTVRATQGSYISAQEVAIDGKILDLPGTIIAPKENVFANGKLLYPPPKIILDPMLLNETELKVLSFAPPELMLGAGPPVTFDIGGGAVTITSGADTFIQTSFVLTGTGSMSLVSGASLQVNSDISANNVNLNMQTAGNIVLADSITSINGNLTLISNVDINAATAVSITTTGTGNLTLVADNFYVFPDVGPGIINMNSLVAINTGGTVAIYTTPGSNNFPTTINGSATPGTPISNVYYPDGSAAFPFQIFYKGVFVPNTATAEQATNTSLTGTLPSQETEEEASQEESPQAIQSPAGLSTQSVAPCQ